MAYFSKRSIEEFKTNLANGGVRPTMFEVSITPPTYIINNTSGLDADISDEQDNTSSSNDSESDSQSSYSERFTFLVKASTLPGSQIASIEVPFRGRRLKVAGDRTFANWQTTLYADGDYKLRNLMEKWAEYIQNHNYALGLNNVNKYMGTGLVRQLNRQGKQLKAYQFNAIWPVSISEIQLDFEANDQIETYDVEWAVNYWHAANRDQIPKGNTVDDPNTSASVVDGNINRVLS